MGAELSPRFCAVRANRGGVESKHVGGALDASAGGPPFADFELPRGEDPFLSGDGEEAFPFVLREVGHHADGSSAVSALSASAWSTVRMCWSRGRIPFRLRRLIFPWRIWS